MSEDYSAITYAVWDGSSIKIGRSNNDLSKRLSGLQVGNSQDLQLIAYSTKRMEKEVHEKLRRYRRQGEWFVNTIEVLNEIKSWCWTDSRIISELENKTQVVTERYIIKRSHGGARAGAGRKRVRQPVVTYSVDITHLHAELLALWGNGDISAGLRWLVDAAIPLIKKKDKEDTRAPS